MKKLVTILLVAALLIPHFAVAETPEVAEPDTVTRAEFARIVVHMLRRADDVTEARSFADVPQDHWVSGYIAMAVELDIVRGGGDGYFRPDDAITFVESVVMLMRALNYQRMATAQGGFPIGYMIAAVTAGITNDVGAVDIDSPLTRNIAWRMVNSALNAPIMQYVVWGETIEYRIGANPQRPTLLDTVWYGYDIYFDGENFVFPRAIAEVAGTITRAEMARIVVYLRNMGDSGRWYTAHFSDVPRSHWADRYIGVATRAYSIMQTRGVTHQGVVSGNDDHQFRPNDFLLIEDAIAILMQTLGYSPMVRAATDGQPPLSYLDVAELAGLTEGLEFTVGESVTPELLYELVNRALDIPVMQGRYWHVGYHVMDGTGDTELATPRTEFWHNAPVYFDGENFIIPQN